MASKAYAAEGGGEAVAFFREHGGYSYDHTTETPEQGREACARAMADAEAWLLAQDDYSVEWVQDENYNPADYDVPDMPDVGYGCIVRVGEEQASLWGITFTDTTDHTNSPYARVVVAELASELMPE